MECNVTRFDKVLHYIEEVPADKKEELYELITDYSFTDVLDFAVENSILSRRDAQTVFDSIIMYEDFESNYFEEDEDKINAFYEKLGVDIEELKEYQLKHDEELKEIEIEDK